MNTLKTIPDQDMRSRFEKAARRAGHNNFTRRGALYCVSDLNTLAEGFCMALADRLPVLAEAEPATARVDQPAR